MGNGRVRGALSGVGGPAGGTETVRVGSTVAVGTGDSIVAVGVGVGSGDGVTVAGSGVGSGEGEGWAASQAASMTTAIVTNSSLGNVRSKAGRCARCDLAPPGRLMLLPFYLFPATVAPGALFGWAPVAILGNEPGRSRTGGL